MKYVKQYIQETVKAKTPEEFDVRMNSIFAKASRSQKDPDIHYYDCDGYSATVRYFIHAEIPESLAEEFEVKGEGKKCFECPSYRLPEDKRIKYTHCEHVSGRITANDNACDWYYETYERRMRRDEVKAIPLRKKPV